MASTLQLREINVVGLFGSKNYEIELERDEPTVLTGSNGSGKSTVLGLVKAASSGDIGHLATAPLSRFELVFDQGGPFTLQRDSNGRTFSIGWDTHPEEVFDVVPAMEELPPWAEAFAIDLSTFGRKTASVQLRELAREGRVPFSEYQRVAQYVSSILDGRERLEPPRWMSLLARRFPVALVTDQRLLIVESEKRQPGSRDERRATSRAVENASDAIESLMRQADSIYSDESKAQDRRFPRAVIAAITNSDVIPEGELLLLEQEVDARRTRLHRVGLLVGDPDVEPLVPEGSLNNNQVRPVIATFLQSTLRKLEVLEELTSKLTAFKDFLDRRFVDKETVLSKTEGVRFRLPTGQQLPATNLSSGEQQMMMLAYEIVFVAQPGTLLLIDEPELSLHVQWQDTLLRNLSEMGAASGLQFLMATHSPTLIAQHRDSERPLDELVAEA